MAILISELRIENWVNLIVLDQKIQIESISRNVGMLGLFTWMHEDTEYEDSLSAIDPIPLTPGILTACGFDKSHSSEYWTHYKTKNSWHISEWVAEKPVAGFEEKGCFYYGDEYTTIKYLHQLQNLYFALTQKEIVYEPK